MVGIAVAWIWMVISILSPPNWRPEVAEKLYAAANAAGEGGGINMATVAPFAWDRMYEFEAYTTDENVSRTIGFDWGTGDVARLSNDDFVLLIFAEDRHVTGWVIINDYGSTGPVVTFGADLAGVPIDRDRAIFRVGRLSGSAGEVTRDAYELHLGP